MSHRDENLYRAWNLRARLVHDKYCFRKYARKVVYVMSSRTMKMA